MGKENRFEITGTVIESWYPIGHGDAVAVAIYGAYAFVNRNMASYLILKNQFVFFDFGQSRLRFMADYASMMCLFACIGAALSKGLKMLKRPKRGVSKDE